MVQSTELKVEFLSPAEAARIMGCTVGRVYQLLWAGDMRGKKIGLRTWLVPIDEARRMSPARLTGRPRKFADSSISHKL